MFNRTDCAGVFMGELACRVCQEWKMALELNDENLSNLMEKAGKGMPLCVKDLVAEIRTLRMGIAEAMAGAHTLKEVVVERNGDVQWLEQDNETLRTRLAKALWALECEETYRVCFLNVRYRHILQPEKYADVRECAMQEMVDILGDAREAI